ncbi:hypothetical protein [Paraburkholderia kirstenboschensis]|uniref:Response regulatory domain-containing protein n=1 Tax=Paraburkholderia kirstenboschensis TaxID=1245436 RepID=A0ABZ0EKF9_9BURK|nr:hypothetical protein [Paraburkholderia kirstenboschensis]WOD17061.1 hypothetical protein RW095_14595 [Paraburkholderia kirstenboschensis]
MNFFIAQLFVNGSAAGRWCTNSASGPLLVSVQRRDCLPESGVDRADEALDVLAAGGAFDFIPFRRADARKMSGIDLAGQVRRRWTVKIAWVTGYPDEIERAKLGGTVVLAKPFNIDELRAWRVSASTARPNAYRLAA